MDSFRLAAVQRLLTDRYPRNGPGAAFLLVADGRIVMQSGYGCADVHSGTPVTPFTLFDLASVSKHFTAYAVMLFLSEGTLAPTDEVRTYIPELSSLGEGVRPIRVSDLLFHCSGLPDYTSELDSEEYLNFTNARLIDWLSEQPELDFPPGTRGISHLDDSTYSNTNYALLASIVERIAGHGFPYFLKTRIFDALGMNDTFCDPWIPNHPGQAKRYDRNGHPIEQPRVIPVMGDGNVFSTIADFARWNAELSHPSLLSQTWVESMWETGKLDDGRATDYAWGWQVRSWPNKRVVWHGGSWDGASTCFSRWLNDHVHLALFSNTQQFSATDIISEIEEIILDR